jgi:hypothetical protein
MCGLSMRVAPLFFICTIDYPKNMKSQKFDGTGAVGSLGGCAEGSVTRFATAGLVETFSTIVLGLVGRFCPEIVDHRLSMGTRISVEEVDTRFFGELVGGYVGRSVVPLGDLVAKMETLGLSDGPMDGNEYVAEYTECIADSLGALVAKRKRLGCCDGL